MAWIRANSTGAFTIGAVGINNTGTITNSGVGTATTTISGIIGANVTGVELLTKPLGSVSGRVVLEHANLPECKGKRPPAFAEIVVNIQRHEKDLADEDPLLQRFIGSVDSADATGAFVLRNLRPGAAVVGRPVVALATVVARLEAVARLHRAAFRAAGLAPPAAPTTAVAALAVATLVIAVVVTRLRSDRRLHLAGVDQLDLPVGERLAVGAEDDGRNRRFDRGR